MGRKRVVSARHWRENLGLMNHCYNREISMSYHSFEPRIAKKVGLNAAVIFQNITFWIEKNQANRRNLRDGRYWTYNSISAFGELFPYLSEKQIRTALEKLVSAELIIKGNFSDDRYDRTCWYALGNSICLNGQIDPTERENDAFAPEGKPSAPEGKSYKNRYKPYQKPKPSQAKAVVEDGVSEKILSAYPEDRIRGKAVCLSQIRQALADGVEPKDLEQAVRAYATQSEGFTRSKVCFSDNWFTSGRWLKQLHDVEEAQEVGKAKEAELLKGLAEWVTSKHSLCRHITPGQVDALLAAELVTQTQIRAAGLRS